MTLSKHSSYSSKWDSNNHFFFHNILRGTLEVSSSYESQTELQNCHFLFPSDSADVVISSTLDGHKDYFKIDF